MTPPSWAASVRIEDEYRRVVEGFVRWSEENHLQLNIGKNKELVVDFRWSRKPPTPISIQGVEKEIGDAYKFLGVRINNKLDSVADFFSEF